MGDEPIPHIGYLASELLVRLHWLDRSGVLAPRFAEGWSDARGDLLERLPDRQHEILLPNGAILWSFKQTKHQGSDLEVEHCDVDEESQFMLSR